MICVSSFSMLTRLIASVELSGVRRQNNVVKQLFREYLTVSSFGGLVRQICTDHQSYEPRKVIMLEEHSTCSPYKLSQCEIESLTGSSLLLKKRLDFLLLHLYLKRRNGTKLPLSIPLHLLRKTIQTEYIPNQAYVDLFLVKSRKLAKAWEYQYHRLDVPNFLQYRSSKNSLMNVLSGRTKSLFYGSVLHQGMQFGQDFVFDFSFSSCMNDNDFHHLGVSIRKCLVENWNSRRPFHLHFCNLSRNDRMCHFLKLWHENTFDSLPISVTNLSYVDVFPREKVVYLHPHAKQYINYDPDDVYIIGAVTARHAKLLELVKNVRVGQLPREVKWRSSGHWMTLDQVMLRTKY